MANQPESLELFKNLPLRAGGPKPGTREGEELPPVDPTQDPEEFPLGEYEVPPQVIEEEPAPPPPAEESGTPPPEESQIEEEPVIEPDPEPIDPNDEPIEETPPAIEAKGMNEIEMLRQRALLMGIKFSNNISSATLKAKIQARIDGEVAKEAAASLMNGKPVEPEEVATVAVDTNPLSPANRQKMYDQEMKLVRLRITNLDPKKKDLPGEIFTVANRVLGAVKKYIPYGEATDNGYHVPYFIYRQLKEREFLNIRTRKDRQGRTIVESSMVREFALEELPQLTQAELNKLAAQQAAAAGMD